MSRSSDYTSPTNFCINNLEVVYIYIYIYIFFNNNLFFFHFQIALFFLDVQPSLLNLHDASLGLKDIILNQTFQNVSTFKSNLHRLNVWCVYFAEQFNDRIMAVSSAVEWNWLTDRMVRNIDYEVM